MARKPKQYSLAYSPTFRKFLETNRKKDTFGLSHDEAFTFYEEARAHVQNAEDLLRVATYAPTDELFFQTVGEVLTRSDVEPETEARAWRLSPREVSIDAISPEARSLIHERFGPQHTGETNKRRKWHHD